jgi:hypothetical protein
MSQEPWTREQAAVARRRRRPAMVAGRGCALLAVLALAALTAPAADAQSGDAAATSAYIQANYALVQSLASKIPRVEATVHGVLSRTRRECALAGAGSPQDPESTQMSNEVIGAMITAVVQLEPAAGRRFVAAAGRLRWSSGELTRTIGAYVAKVRTLVALVPPALCADVHAWAAAGFHTLPASTVRFDAVFMPNWVAAGDLPAGLARFETAAERSLLTRTEHMESELTELEAREVETWGRIMNTLELWP